jgi:regulator of sigma E protease
MLVAIFVLTFLIFFHELGHFIAGRAIGVAIKEFTVGVGPGYTHHQRGTNYHLGLFLLGGAVIFHTEETAAPGAQLLEKSPPHRRLFVSAAGPAFNVLLAIIGYAVIYAVFYKYSIGDAFLAASIFTWEMTVLILQGVGLLITGSTAVSEGLGGPVAIVEAIQEAQSQSWVEVVELSCYVSLNLAILNMLPVPVLDGGRIVLDSIELIRGRAVSVRAQERLYQIGVLFLVGLIFYITFHDILRVAR